LCLWYLSSTLRGLKDGQKETNNGVARLEKEVRAIKKHLGFKALISEDKEDSSTV
jgi:hypothetical protein